MNILLLGSSSYVGARLYTDLAAEHDVMGTYAQHKLMPELEQLDVTDSAAMLEIVEGVRPDVIVHAANNANPRWCEANPEQAVALNQTSTQSVTDAANAVGAQIIYISSCAAAEPFNVYGRTKKASEEIVTHTRAGWLVLRPSLIIGLSPNTTNDRPFNRFLKNIDQGTPAEYDTSWKFQPTWVGHLSEVILEVLRQKVSCQVLTVAVPEIKTRYDIAKDILEPFGVHVTPIDAQDTSPHFADDLHGLQELGLPMHSYAEIITKIVAEIKGRPPNLK